jgi:Uma2 family endonuclease
MTVVTAIEFGRPYTSDDLAAMPDDGRRYEVLDGALLVTPAPSWPHQHVVLSLAVLLKAACPDHLTVLVAPFDYRQSESTTLQPDVLVARVSEMTYRNLPKAPVLAIEVRSPSTALIDRELKRAAYERAGVPSYWIVDPQPQPTVTIFELDAGRYGDGRVCTDLVEVAQPFELSFAVADLVRGLPS